MAPQAEHLAHLAPATAHCLHPAGLPPKRFAGWVPDAEIIAGVPRYDIAAVKLETPIVGAKVAALVRPDADLGASGLELQVAGFGETETAFISKVGWRCPLHACGSA